MPRNERLFTGLIFGRPSPGHGRDHAGLGIIAPNSVRLCVRDIHHVVGVEGDGGRPCQIGLEGWTVSVEAMLSSSDDRGNDTGLMVHLPDSVTAGIADIEVVAGVKGDVERQIESGFTTGPLIAAIAGFADAGEIVKRTFAEIDPPDTIRPGLGKVEPGLGLVECRVMGQRNSGLDRPFSIAGATGLTVTCKGFDITGRKLKFGFHLPVTLSRLVSRVTLNEPARLVVPLEPLFAPVMQEERVVAERLPSAAEPLERRLRSHPPHAQTF